MSSRLFARLNRPEYFFQPRVLYRRVLDVLSGRRTQRSCVHLPWGVQIPVEKVEYGVEAALRLQGIYDLALSEMLWRLIEPGEIVADIGANIGYVTSLMATRVGLHGKVYSFEPNPETYAELAANIQRWQHDWGGQIIHPSLLALSDQNGNGIFRPDRQNRGMSRLLTNQDNVGLNKSIQDDHTIYVQLMRLDAFLPSGEVPAVIKLDVEGHELAVLRGATQLLESGMIRDILFEEHLDYPTATTDFLEQHGFHILRIHKIFWRPQLLPPSHSVHHPWEPPNYLATRQLQRAKHLVHQRGWLCLRASRSINRLP